MLSKVELIKQYGDTHLDLIGVQDDNVFLRGYIGELGYDLLLVHIKSSGINKALVIRTEPIHKFKGDEWGVILHRIPVIESVRVTMKGSDEPEVIYIN